MSSSKRLLFFIIFCCLPFLSFSKTQDRYAVLQIPPDLLNNAKAIIRFDSTEIEIQQLNFAKYKRKYAITILNEDAAQLGKIQEWYDNQSKITNISGSFYDREGKLIKSIKNKEIVDRSAFGLEGIYNSDNRLKIYNFTHHSYPYTFVFEMEKTLKSIFFLPTWQPQRKSYCALESSDFKITYPKELNIREKAFLMPKSAINSATIESRRSTITWHLENLQAFEMQALSTNGNFTLPTLLLVPSQFELMGYKGNMDSWKSFGLFFYQLNEGRDHLSESMKLKIAKLIKNEHSILQKVQVLYQEMQENTRYVADEYGLSGWQSFDADFVCTKGYGDCKGLTNYLKSLLKEAGIPAYTSLISAGENHFKVDVQFPANYFNHVILCVPNGKDTLWVECTSSHLKAGYLGRFTENRHTLICTENGGYLVKTPEYGKEKTFLNRTAKLFYDSKENEQQVLLENTYSGLFQDDLFHLLKSKDNELLNQVNNRKFLFPSYTVQNYKTEFSGSNQLPQIIEKATLKVKGITYKTNQNTIVNFGWMSNPMENILQLQSRTEPIVLQNSFLVSDSIYFYFSQELNVENLPKSLIMSYPFGALHLNFHKHSDHILLVRQYEQKAGSYNAALYKDYQKMYALLKAQQTQLSVVFN